MEFTRLAQITGNATYYDAIARITNALDEFQMNTTFPGLWPIHIDASGCKKLRRHQKDATVPSRAGTQPTQPVELLVDERKLRVEPKVGGTGKDVTPEWQSAPVKRPFGSGRGGETPIHVPARVGGTGKEVTPNPQVAPARHPVTEGVAGEEVPIQVPAVVGGTGTEVHTHEKRSDHGAQSTDDDDDVKEAPTREGAKSPNGGEAAPSRPQGAQGPAGHRPIPTRPQHIQGPAGHRPIPKRPQHIQRPAGRGYQAARKPNPIVQPEKCQPQGLVAPHLIREEKYSLGSMIDSLYEYLLKVCWPSSPFRPVHAC